MKPYLCSSLCYIRQCDFLSYCVKCEAKLHYSLYTSFNQLRRILAVCEMRALLVAVLAMAVFLTVTDAYRPALICYQSSRKCAPGSDYSVSFSIEVSKCCDLLL